MEILGRETAVANEAAAAFFFNDLAESNGVPPEHRAFHTIDGEALAAGTADPELVVHAGTETVHICAGIGFQKQVAMGRDVDQDGNSRAHLQEQQTIRVDLVVLRLLQQETDLLMTVSTPMNTADVPAAFPAVVPASAMNEIILRAVSSMKIKDWGLFG